MVTRQLYLDDGTVEYIILCKFGSHIISGYRVTGVGPPVPGSLKEPGLNRVQFWFVVNKSG